MWAGYTYVGMEEGKKSNGLGSRLVKPAPIQVLSNMLQCLPTNDYDTFRRWKLGERGCVARIETEGGVSDDASREGRFPFSLVVLPVPAKYSLSQQAGHRRVSSCLKDM
jgi:hypothetical protein